MERKNPLQARLEPTGHLDTGQAPHLHGGQVWRGQLRDNTILHANKRVAYIAIATLVCYDK